MIIGVLFLIHVFLGLTMLGIMVLTVGLTDSQISGGLRRTSRNRRPR